MQALEERILAALGARDYAPLKPKSLARKLGLTPNDYPAFRRSLKDLIQRGQARLGKNSIVGPGSPLGVVTATYRRLGSGKGVARTTADELTVSREYSIPSHLALDAASGDEVRLRVLRKPTRAESGVAEVVEVLKRSTVRFVGTFRSEFGTGLVKIDSNAFQRSIVVGDAETKQARDGEKVVVDIAKFPTATERGEGVLIEVLGRAGDPIVDRVSIVRALGIPDEFPPEVLAEAQLVVRNFRDDDLGDRDDFTQQLVITVDPITAKDFDDAVSLRVDPTTEHRILTVHIADVGHFAPPGSWLDSEAKKRATSVYLPGHVIPMFPELISNGVASLQQGKLRYVKTVVMEFTADGKRVHTKLANGAIRVAKRFAYEEVSALLAEPDGAFATSIDPAIRGMIDQMKSFAMTLRKRRFKKGALELTMPETVLDIGKDGGVSGAHAATHDVSHQIIEEFMLATNVAVAEHFNDLEIPFLRRVHPAPEPTKLLAFAAFARLLGHPIERYADRYELQRLLDETATKPERQAIHYALLRSFKQASYSPYREEHYALAFNDYCHFTSPIRRYPDLTVHRLVTQELKRGRGTGDKEELAKLGAHCSQCERRAETAEREVTKLRLMRFLQDKIGLTLDATITGVNEFGFYATGEQLPAEGFVRISTLGDDYYSYIEDEHKLEGKRTRKRYRLGDRVKVEVSKVDIDRKQLDFAVVGIVKHGGTTPKAPFHRKPGRRGRG